MISLAAIKSPNRRKQSRATSLVSKEIMPTGRTLVLAVLLSINLIAFHAPATGQAPLGLTPLEKSLALDYWSESRFSKFEDDAPLSLDELREVDRLVQRLANLDRRVFYESPSQLVTTAKLAAAPDDFRGQAVRLQGVATSLANENSAPKNVPSDAPPAIYCEAHDEGGPCLIATSATPARWKRIDPLNEPVAVDGIFIKMVKLDDGALAPLIAAPRVEWMPRKWSPPAVNYGMSVLGIMGQDVAMLDGVVHRSPLERSETAAFYRLLAGISGSTANELVNWANRHAPRHRDTWSDALESTDPKQRALAREVIRMADKDQYSVAPFFNEPHKHVGQLAVFDGVLRRAIRIEMADDLDAAAAGLDHYYELALFTDDSQNNPLMFCVLDVPPDMPLGDDIRQPVRLAGFFFKNWRYSSRRADEGNREQYRFAPMFIGRAALRIVPAPAEPIWGWIVGLGFIALVLLIWYAGWRRSRADRTFADSTLARIKQTTEPVDLNETSLTGSSE